MELDKNFKEFIELLNAHKVHYLVIGGYAVNFHGYPRYTKDLDFWLWMTDENLDRLLAAIRSFGFGNIGLQVEDFKDPENIIQLGYEPYRIDLLMDINGIDFESCFQRKTTGNLNGISVNFLSLEDLIQAKKNTGRLKDLADAEELQRLRNRSKKNDTSS